MPTLTVLVGLPASGKSTSIPEDFKGFVFSTDAYIEDAARHFGSTYNDMFADNIKAANQAMYGRLEAAIKKSSDIIWDQTNMAASKRKGILSRFPNTYRKVCICRVPPRNESEWAELKRRLLSREGKSIPPHIVQSMANSYTIPTLEEGFDEVHIHDIYGNAI